MNNRVFSANCFTECILPLIGERSIVWTNGCFDLLHIGHEDILKKAQSLGNILVIGLNDDASIRSLKGSLRPYDRFSCRARKILDIVPHSYIIRIGEDPTEIIESIMPDIIVKGEDYEGKWVAGSSLVKEFGGRVIYHKFTHKISTTAKARRLGFVEPYLR